MNDSHAKSSINITNLESEKRKFLFDQQYNPQFNYENEIPEKKLQKYGSVSGEYLPLAERILQTVIKKFGSEEEFIAQEGSEVSQEQAEKRMREYVQLSGLENRVTISFSSKYIARTAIAFENNQFTLKVRLPTDYREHNLVPILNHEIGTHVFRWLNEEKQPWFGKHQEYGLAEYLETEEGLAVLNYMTDHPAPYLWMPSLYYFATYHAQFLSFSELAKKVRPFVDSAERRWKLCVRVKRGFTDTSIPGAYTKDQLYLSGATKVAQWLSEHQYDVPRLYLGKVSLEDVDRLAEARIYSSLLPHFVQDPEYLKKLKTVIALNKLNSSLEKTER